MSEFEADPVLMRAAGSAFSDIGDGLWGAWQAHLAALPSDSDMFSNHPDKSAAAKLDDYRRAASLVERAVHLASKGIADVDDGVRTAADAYDKLDAAGKALVFSVHPAE